MICWSSPFLHEKSKVWVERNCSCSYQVQILESHGCSSHAREHRCQAQQNSRANPVVNHHLICIHIIRFFWTPQQKGATVPPSAPWLQQTKLTWSLWPQWATASKETDYNRKLCSKPIPLQDFQTTQLDIIWELSNPAQQYRGTELAGLDFTKILNVTSISVQNSTRRCLDEDVNLLRHFSGQPINHFTTIF